MNSILPLSNDPRDISENITREYALRRFNKDALGMETGFGSPIEKVIGVGKRMNPKTGELVDVTSLYFTFYKHVITDFERYPIFEHFGVTPEDAMAMPVDRWYYMRKAAARVAENKQQTPDPMLVLLEYLKGLTEALGGG
jgi:hypothetical protein